MPLIEVAEQEIHYRAQGEGETLLLLPDNLHSSTAYQEEIELFSEELKVVSFDYPGTGRSTRDVKYLDEQQYDLWNLRADFACHLLLELEIGGCYVMGSAEGALVALHFAGKQARLHGLTVHGAVADSFLCRIDRRTLHRALDTREHYYVRHAASLAEEHGEDWRDVLDADTAFLRQLADHGGYEFPQSVLSSVPCPAILTGNLSDAETPRIAREYARLSALIPECSIHLEGRSGHAYEDEHPLLRTDPATFRSIVELFIAKTRRLTK